MLSYEVFHSEQGIFIAVPENSGVFAADTIVYDGRNRSLALENDGEPLAIRMAKLPSAAVPLLQGASELTFAEFAIGGVVRADIRPLRLIG
ncbi:hypothetical protein ACFFU8_09040 [Chromobacterium piscinae]